MKVNLKIWWRFYCSSKFVFTMSGVTYSDSLTLQELFANAYGIKSENVSSLVENAKDFAFSKGIAMRYPDLSHDARVPIPFCLVPSFFPEYYFYFLSSLQTEINHVLHKVAHSRDFLARCLSSTIKADPFTAKVWEIYETVLDEGVAQPVSLGLIRSDYMLNTDSNGEIINAKQIENNTISISFGGVSPFVAELHSYILNRAGKKDAFAKLPENESTLNLAKGIISAWDIYGKDNAVVLFVVEDVTLNICDQRAIEYAIWDYESGIEILRHTFSELGEFASLKDNCLYVNGKEVALVYYRTGYVPEDYSAKDWDVRLLMERSHAIKCPTVGLHLAGTKRVQLELTHPGVVENFLPDRQSSNRIREVFAGFHSLDMNDDGDKAVQMAIKNPQKFIMKPEREGGGHNVHGDKVRQLLEDIGSTAKRQGYILMEKINPPANPNYIIQKNAVPKISNVVSELGIFGVVLGTEDEIFQNYQAGHLLRSKQVEQNEGGIAAGFGALDSPYLQ